MVFLFLTILMVSVMANDFGLSKLQEMEKLENESELEDGLIEINDAEVYERLVVS